MQQAFDADILVNVGPRHPLSSPELPISAMTKPVER